MTAFMSVCLPVRQVRSGPFSVRPDWVRVGPVGPVCIYTPDHRTTGRTGPTTVDGSMAHEHHWRDSAGCRGPARHSHRARRASRTVLGLRAEQVRAHAARAADSVYLPSGKMRTQGAISMSNPRELH